MKITGIYKIQSKLKFERIYIGSSVNISQRWCTHLKELKRGSHHSSKLQNHYNKYGESDLIFSILINCEKEDLIKSEQYFIDSYNPWFNISKIAGSPLGTHHKLSEETKQKMRKPKSEETKLKMKKPKSKEHCQKIAKSAMGHKRNIGRPSHRKGIRSSDETRKKQSISHIGIIPWNKGKTGTNSQEQLIKMAEGRRKAIIAKKVLQTSLN